MKRLLLSRHLEVNLCKEFTAIITELLLGMRHTYVQ